MENSPNIMDSAPKVINISSYDPSPSEISLLKRGLKFCPTPQRSDLLNLEVDIAELVRKIELINYFSSFNNNQDDEECLISKKSDFQPLPSRDPFLSNICSQIKDYASTLSSLPKPKWKSNLPRDEQDAIKSLANNHNIRITRVDKGSSVLITNKCDYINIIEEDLSNTSLYKKLSKNCDNKVMKTIKNFTHKYRSNFDSKGKEIKFINDFDFSTSNLYGLPKIHKSTVIKKELCNSINGYLKISRPVDLNFRLIHGSVNCPTSKLSEFIDLLLKPLCEKVPSYVRDYVDFLNKLPSAPCDNIDDVIFYTCDIVKMYPNINFNELGSKAVWYWMSKFPEVLNPRFSPEFIIEALEIIMHNSNFSFNGSFYSLLKGTVTGTVVAPSYAILSIGYLEVMLYRQVKEKFGEQIHDYFVLNWKRYLDDCFIIWRKSFGNFNDILALLNNLDNNIVFTVDQSSDNVSFLNLTVYKKDNFILTDIFYKDTDTHDYLPFNSCHPRHTTTNIPGSLARMICTIVDDPLVRDKRLDDLFIWLCKSGYPKSVISQKFNNILNIDKSVLRQKISKEDNKSLVFVQTHNPLNPYVFKYLRNMFDNLCSSKKFGDIFNGFNLIKSERQPKNLGRILQKSNLCPPMLPNGSFKCGKSNCGTCDYLLETQNVEFITDGNIIDFKVLKHFKCYSADIIYKIQCQGCPLFYIGQTTNLRNRVTDYKFKISNSEYRVQKVHKHIFDCAGHLEIPFTIVPFYQVKQNSLIARLTIEDYFIRKFKPSLNAGN